MDLNGVLCFVLFLVPVLTMVCSFKRNVCLDTVLKFGLSDVACKFKESDLETRFKEPTLGRFPCNKQCELKVDLDDNFHVFKVKKVQIFAMDKKRVTLETHQCQSTHGVKFKVDCSSKELKNYFGHVCSNKSDILKLNTTCSKPGEMGTCACKNGSILVNGSCKKDGLVLGESCDDDRQCTGSANSRNCSMSKCDCQSGYYSKSSECYPRHAKLGNVCVDNEQCFETTNNSWCENSTKICNCCPGFYVDQSFRHCERNKCGMETTTPNTQIGTSEPNSEHQIFDVTQETLLEGSNTGIIVTVGVCFGCFVLGVVVSLGIVFIVLKCRSQGNQNNEISNNVDNPTYNKHIECGESSQTRNKPDTVSSMSMANKNTAYSSVQMLSDIKGDIYNHLHEPVTSAAALDDDYDHAKPLKKQINPDDNYSHLSPKNNGVENSKDNDPNKDVPKSGRSEENIDENTDENTDNYFTLEKIN